MMVLKYALPAIPASNKFSFAQFHIPLLPLFISTLIVTSILENSVRSCSLTKKDSTYTRIGTS